MFSMLSHVDSENLHQNLVKSLTGIMRGLVLGKERAIAMRRIANGFASEISSQTRS